MTSNKSAQFLGGVIEGFYGAPWSKTERQELFGWMAQWGLNTYLYCPKDDLKHRSLWRELYAPAEAETIKAAIEGCKAHGLRFIYGLAPGLDVRYSQESELLCLKKRFEQMLSLGCGDFALLFDDIPDSLDAEDHRRWGSFALAQCHLANAMLEWTRDRSPEARFLFCPTPYCERMAERQLGGADYLDTLGRMLHPEIDVFWTGPEIISSEIPIVSIREIARILRRKPLIWDNLHANDYDGRRFYCGPYTGRPLELRGEAAGLLSNPNNEFVLNYAPLRTLAGFIHCEAEWHPRNAYLEAMRGWLPSFQTVHGPLALEDLVLFGDCFYLPHQDGDEAAALYKAIRKSLALKPGAAGNDARVARGRMASLRTFCSRVAELQCRPLFYALSRRVWELREELDLLDRFLERLDSSGADAGRFGSDFHLPGTYRGGFANRLQQLLMQQSDGSFSAARLDENPLGICGSNKTNSDPS